MDKKEDIKIINTDKIHPDVKKIIEIAGQKYLNTVAGHTISSEEKVAIFLGWCEGASWFSDKSSEVVKKLNKDIEILSEELLKAQELMKELYCLVELKTKVNKYHLTGIVVPETVEKEIYNLELKLKIRKKLEMVRN